MARTKLIAIRTGADLLGIIDEYCCKRSYLNRSQVINRILESVLRCSDEQTLHTLIETADPYSAGYSVSFLQVVNKK